MGLMHLLSKSRGTRNLISRIGTILRRFGITSKRFKRILDRYSAIADKLGCVPTFPITAVILKRHPKLIREYRQRIEFAVHGYIHIDHGVLPLEEQIRHYQKAIDTFVGCRLPFTGFRAPFLRINDKTHQALGTLKFPYDSSWAIQWDVIDRTKYAKEAWVEYERLLAFYQSRQANDYLALPRAIDGLTEIPVSMPDDEVMIERLGITDGRKISDIWKIILESAYNRGELFTIQLHPERITECENALTDVIRKAKALNPPVWIATLGQISNWWKERGDFTFKIESQGKGRYRVHTNCSDRATVLVKHCRADTPAVEWFDNYQSINAGDFILESEARPVIGVARDSSPAAVNFLKSEGYVVEVSEQSDNYAVYLNNLAQFREPDEKSLSEKLDKSNIPLLRYWRWPDRARSAVSVTGDIDSITLWDFGLRIFENWRQNRRQKA